ncbi:MAG TPA: HAMP domain-containing sensor histidine kinase, partial [Longimicrobiales bacterium]|nr:HAMP domain-containing sensor histidine kinase [Longimicrobiales bacterium]
RAWAEKVVDTVEDTEFFLEEPETRFQTGDVTRVLQEVTREFAGEFDAMVKLRAPDGPLRARLAPEAFKDAVYLVLANAAHFSRGQPVELTVEDAGGRLRIRVRDRGPGFSSEALERGTEPFFTTDEGALGLGLPHVRRIVEMHAGELHVRNREEGGGEVEIVIPRGLD